MAKRPSLAAKMREVAAPVDLPPPQTAQIGGPAPVDAPPAAAPRFYAATRAGKKKVTASLEPGMHKQLKQLALDRDTTAEALLREALRDLFTKYGPGPRD